jgi:hypothetical protein
MRSRAKSVRKAYAAVATTLAYRFGYAAQIGNVTSCAMSVAHPAIVEVLDRTVTDLRKVMPVVAPGPDDTLAKTWVTFS